jgi:hypothetical protein
MKTAHRTAAKAKRYYADPTSWITTLAANSDQCPQHATSIVVKVRTAFERLKSGSGEPADFDRVGAAINVGLVRSESIDPLAEQTMQAGADAMVECDGFWQRHGRFGFTGPGLTAVTDAIELYEGIVRMSKPIQMERAVEEVARRLLESSQCQ